MNQASEMDHHHKRGLTLGSSILLTALTLGASPALATTWYTSPNGSSDGAATKEDPVDLFTVNELVEPGDIVEMADGTYNEVYIEPKVSGTANKPITYRAAKGAKPIITGETTAIYIEDRSHIVIEGVRAHDVYFWIEATRATNIWIKDCTFTVSDAYAPTNFTDVDRIHVSGSYFDGGEDSLHIHGGGHHLIEDNTFVQATHECLFLGGVHDSVVRRNHFSNPSQKLIDMTGMLDTEWDGEILPSKRVVIEDNIFAFSTGEDTSFAGIQLVAIDTIVRNNIFEHCGYSVDISSWDDSAAAYSLNATIYHNTFYKNGALPGGVAIFLSHYDENAEYGGHLVMNNLFVDNVSSINEEGIASSSQVTLNWNAQPSHLTLAGNLFEVDSNKIIGMVGDATTLTLSEFEPLGSSHDNAMASGLLVNPNNEDFSPIESSDAIDSALFLTTTVGDGQGKTLIVKDSRFFSDGRDLVEADTIVVGGEVVQLASIDYATHTLTLKEAITWQDGSPVSLEYVGAAPDVGALELGDTLDVTPIDTPEELQVGGKCGCSSTGSSLSSLFFALGLVLLRRKGEPR